MLEKSQSDILEKLRDTVIECNSDDATELAERAIREGIDPLRATDALYEGIKEVGRGFAEGRLFLPDLMMAADAMKAALGVLTKEMEKTGQKKKTLGKIVIGSVKGDIHDIGKTIVCTMFSAEGFDVIDAGVDVELERFVEAVKDQEPDILGLSALLTVTAEEMRNVIAAVSRAGIRNKVKIIVGGGAVTADFAREIGADGYAASAIEAVREGKQLLGITKKGAVE
jgi:corrinoid protein of di/trimethylamine methyltransferase